MERATYSGLWWLPEAPETKLAGTLEVYPSELSELRLVGSFKELTKLFEDTEYPAVFGFTDRGRLISIANGLEKETKFSSPGFSTQIIGAPLVLVGSHIRVEDAFLTEAFLGFTYLAEWIGQGGWHEGMVEADGPQFEIGTEEMALPSAAIGDVRLDLRTGWRVTGDRVHERGLKFARSVRLQFESPVTFESLLADWSQSIQQFLSLGVDRPVMIAKVSFRALGEDGKPMENLVDAYYDVREPPPSRRRPPIHRDMLFALPDISGDFGDIVAAWYKITRELGDVTDLYFSTRYTAGYVEPQFLALSQSLEVLHRRTRPDGVVPKAQHRKVVATIVDAVPGELRAWLKLKLSHSNEPALVERFVYLFGRIGQILAPIVGDVEEFARLTADTRHYYTHFDPKMAKRAVPPSDLFRHNQKLGIAIQSSLLLACGFSVDRVEVLMNQFPPYLDLLMRARAGAAPSDPGNP